MAWLPGLLVFCLYSTAAKAASKEGGAHWCYLSQKCQDPHCKEPREWEEVAKACGGTGQSPINIITSKIEYDWNLMPFRFEKYNAKQTSNWSVVNNGHTVQVNLDGSAKISSGGLSGKYKAVQFHFHWGSDGQKSSRRLSPGSEHSIDGERYAMELHIVHIKENYASVSDALKGNGVAVLGFFIEAGKNNENYAPLVSQFREIPFNGNQSSMSPLRLDSLIPKEDDLSSFYRYNGSLTTPDCNTNVVWTLFEKPIELQLEQIQEFWMQLYFGTTKNDSWIVDNFRPTQPVGNRIVFKSDSNTLLPPTKVLLLIPTAACFSLSFLQ